MPRPSTTRFRLVRAYALTFRVALGYGWLRLWKPFLSSSSYEARLVVRHRKTSRFLVAAIIDLGGLFIKVGQLISIMSNFLPEEFRGELQRLQDRVPPRPLEQVTARLQAEFGKGQDELFASFNPDPLASASLAQVHEARLHDGRRVAVKIQHADIEEIARLDLKVLGHVLAIIQFFVHIRGLESYHGDIARLIGEELDFAQEARNIAIIAQRFVGQPDIGFPTVVPEFSTQRVLTTEFVVGTKVTNFAELAERGIDRPALARRILTAYCQMTFVDGVYHADPHPGNIFVGDRGKVIFVDFGAVGRVAPGVKAGAPRFWDGVIKRDTTEINSALRQMGFMARDAGRSDREMAERVIQAVHRRFLEQVSQESFALRDVRVDLQAKLEALGDLKKLDVSFRRLSTLFEVPKEWVILERTTLLLLGLCTEIDPDMNPLQTVGPYLEKFVLGTKRGGWWSVAATALRGTAASTVALPDALTQFLGRATEGELEVRVDGLRDSATLLYAAAHQLVYAILATGSGVIAYLLNDKGNTWMAYVAWGASGIALLALYLSMRHNRPPRR